MSHLATLSLELIIYFFLYLTNSSNTNKIKFEPQRYVVDRGLLSYKQVQAEEAQLPPDERDLVSRLRVFSRFQVVIY
jgi:hypothetical protein